MNFIKSILRNLINVIFVKLNVNRGNVNLNDVSGALHKAWAHIFNNNLHGFYIEFGVYKGNSAIKSLENFNQLKTWSNQQKVSTEVWRRDIALSSPLNQEINFHFLDTFDGMPINKEKNKTFAEGTFKSDFEEVKKEIKKYSLSDSKCYFYKGLFIDSRENLAINIGSDKVAIVNFDCDLESSTADALKIMNIYFQIGSVILFDDYNCFNANNKLGQRKAFRDYLAKTGFIFEKFFNYGYAGQSFLIVDQKNGST